MSRKNRRPHVKNLVDIALLTAGYVDPPVFEKCISAIKREMDTIPSSLYVCMNGKVAETQKAYSDILATVPNIHSFNVARRHGRTS